MGSARGRTGGSLHARAMAAHARTKAGTYTGGARAHTSGGLHRRAVAVHARAEAGIHSGSDHACTGCDRARTGGGLHAEAVTAHAWAAASKFTGSNRARSGHARAQSVLCRAKAQRPHCPSDRDSHPQARVLPRPRGQHLGLWRADMAVRPTASTLQREGHGKLGLSAPRPRDFQQLRRKDPQLRN